MFNKDTFNALWKLQKENDLNLSYPKKIIMASAKSQAVGTVYAATVVTDASVVYQAHNGDIIYLFGNFNSAGAGTVGAQPYSKSPTISQLNKVNGGLFKDTWQKDGFENMLPDETFNDCLVDNLKYAARLFSGMFCLDMGTARTPATMPNHITYAPIK